MRMFVNVVIFMALWIHLTALSTNANPSIYSLKYKWTEDNGDKVAISNWKGSQVILAMAYTECRKICMMTLRKLEEIQALADQKKVPLQFIIVTLDPSIDNPATWRYYRKKHQLQDRVNWHFLTGNDTNTSRLAYLMGIKYWQDTDHMLHEFKILYLKANGDVEKYLDWDNQESASLFK